jgi:hypothetical protein
MALVQEAHAGCASSCPIALQTRHRSFIKLDCPGELRASRFQAVQLDSKHDEGHDRNREPPGREQVATEESRKHCGSNRKEAQASITQRTVPSAQRGQGGIPRVEAN